MRRIVVFGMLWMMCCVAMAQEDDEMELIMRLTGVGDVEELDAEEVERLLRLLEHPVDLNTASSSRLAGCGLMTAYQIAALTDYRMHHGDVMSFMELAAVDGFNADMVEAMRPFVTLSGTDFIPQDRVRGARHELAVRGAGKGTFTTAEGGTGGGEKMTAEGGTGGVKGARPWGGVQIDADWSYGMKYTIEAGPRLTGGLGMTRAYGGDTYAPSAYTGNLQWDFRRIGGKLIIGDFNARFGQGLALWSGMLMDNLSSPSAMMRKPTGLSRASSFTGSSAMSGAAVELGLGSFTLSAAASYPLVALINAAWTGFNGKVSMTHVADGPSSQGSSSNVSKSDDGWHINKVSMRTSADAAFCFNGVNAYGEAVYSWDEHKPSVLAGTDFPTGENIRTGIQVQCNPGTLHCLAASAAGNGRGGRFGGTLSASATYYPLPKKGNTGSSTQVKARFDGEYSFTQRFKLKFRLTERYRTWGPAFKTEARADVSYSSGAFTLMSRIHLLKCDGVSGLGYVEAAWKPHELALYIRQGIFFVDDWDDRIYVYERDAPGSFNVPAMYGRGLWGNVVLSWKVSRAVKIYLRAAYTSYLLMEKKKPGKAELKLQSVFRF